MLFEVRCCCNPAKLHGWIDFDLPKRRPQRVAFALKAPLDEEPEKITLELAWFTEYVRGIDDRDVRILAFKDNHAPIEKLRRIPAFIEWDGVSDWRKNRPKT